MTIASYSDLTTAAANWGARSDLGSRIPEFITLAEAKMNRRLRIRMMVTTDGNFQVNAEYVPLPASFAGVQNWYLNTSPKQPMELEADALIIRDYGDGTSGIPKKYSIQGNLFHVGPTPDASYGSTLTYFLKVPALTSTNTINWMITNHPDAYVYGVQCEMAAYLKDWEASQAWLTAMNQVIDEIKSGSRTTLSAPMAARPG